MQTVTIKVNMYLIEKFSFALEYVKCLAVHSIVALFYFNTNQCRLFRDLKQRSSVLLMTRPQIVSKQSLSHIAIKIHLITKHFSST